jgi:hypothetical protein
MFDMKEDVDLTIKIVFLGSGNVAHSPLFAQMIHIINDSSAGYMAHSYGRLHTVLFD